MTEGLHWESEYLFAIFSLLQTSQMIPDQLLNLLIRFLSSIIGIALLSPSLLSKISFLFLFRTDWTVSSLRSPHCTPRQHTFSQDTVEVETFLIKLCSANRLRNQHQSQLSFSIYYYSRLNSVL